MSIILDLIVIAIVSVCVLTTMKKGFVRSSLNVVALIITVIIISKIASPISSFLYDSFFEKPICSSIENSIVSAEEKSEEVVDKIWEEIPSILTNTAENSGANSKTAFDLVAGESDPKKAALQVSNEIIKPAVMSLLVIGVDIILFSVLMFAFRYLNRIICKLFKAPLLSQVNGFLGAVLGFLKGIVIAILVCSIISFIVAISENGEFLLFNQDVIQKTYLFSKLSSVLHLNMLL